jgi:hypothetical protein
MRLTLNLAKMAKGGFSHTAIDNTQHRIEKPHAKVREEKTRGVEFCGPTRVKDAIESHPAMVYKNQTDGRLPCQNGTAENLVTRWRCKGPGTPPAEPAALLLIGPPRPGTPPAPPGDTDRNEGDEMEGMLSRCVYIHSPHPNTQFFNHNVFAQQSKHDQDCIPDWLSTLSTTRKYH